MSGFKSVAAMAAAGLSFSLTASVDATAKDITASQIPCHTIITDGGVKVAYSCLKNGKGTFVGHGPNVPVSRGTYRIEGNKICLHSKPAVLKKTDWCSEILPGNLFKSGLYGDTHHFRLSGS
jgi:hypothetical protein